MYEDAIKEPEYQNNDRYYSQLHKFMNPWFHH
jgi:hypothetical protein